MDSKETVTKRIKAHNLLAKKLNKYIPKIIGVFEKEDKLFMANGETLLKKVRDQINGFLQFESDIKKLNSQGLDVIRITSTSYSSLIWVNCRIRFATEGRPTSNTVKVDICLNSGGNNHKFSYKPFRILNPTTEYNKLKRITALKEKYQKAYSVYTNSGTPIEMAECNDINYLR